MATIVTRNEVETQILTPDGRRFLTHLAREFEPRGAGFWSAGRLARKRSTWACCPIFCRRPHTSAKRIGPSRRSRTTCSTGASRSPDRSTAR